MGFLGGLIGAVIFISKVMMFMLMYIWFRATFPRFRFDQLMDLGWKWMIPLALANIFVTGIVVLAFGHTKSKGMYFGEAAMSVIGAAILAFTLFLVFRGVRPAPAKGMHASRVSEA
jgi:multisubunit Na+/H+ antiporter MnhB subunit